MNYYIAKVECPACGATQAAIWPESVIDKLSCQECEHQLIDPDDYPNAILLTRNEAQVIVDENVPGIILE